MQRPDTVAYVDGISVVLNDLYRKHSVISFQGLNELLRTTPIPIDQHELVRRRGAMSKSALSAITTNLHKCLR